MAYPTIQNTYATTGNSTFNGGTGLWDFSLNSVAVASLSQVRLVLFVAAIGNDYVTNATWGGQSFSFLPLTGGSSTVLYGSIGVLTPATSATNNINMHWVHAGGGQGIMAQAIVFNGAPAISTSAIVNGNSGTSVSETLTTQSPTSLVFAMSDALGVATQTMGGGQTTVLGQSATAFTVTASSYVSYEQSATLGNNVTMSASNASASGFTILMIEILSMAPVQAGGSFLLNMIR